MTTNKGGKGAQTKYHHHLPGWWCQVTKCVDVTRLARRTAYTRIVSYRIMIINRNRIATLHPSFPSSKLGGGGVPRSRARAQSTHRRSKKKSKPPASPGACLLVVVSVRACRQFHSKDEVLCVAALCGPALRGPPRPTERFFFFDFLRGCLLVAHVIIAPLIITSRASSARRRAAYATSRRALRWVIDLSATLAFRLTQIQPHAEV